MANCLADIVRGDKENDQDYGDGDFEEKGPPPSLDRLGDKFASKPTRLPGILRHLAAPCRFAAHRVDTRVLA